jgi:putative FmdB family regulatory protein
VPIFEFTCQKCGHGFEEIVSLAELEAGEVECPRCGARKLERGLSSFATGSAATGGCAVGSAGGGCGGGGGFT